MLRAGISSPYIMRFQMPLHMQCLEQMRAERLLVCSMYPLAEHLQNGEL